MLYEGAVNFLNRALTGFDKEDPAECNETISNNIIRTQQILSELNASLNLEQGGELAVHLRRVYLYLDWRLNQSNIAKEPSGIHESIKRLTVLRDAWAEMLENQAAAGAEASRQPAMALA
jgi:flagellar protein FliS